ncbi:hypothetical protein DFJ77DRAFT_511709 [Powellomyces hirtus]|nr:hypothetical protein DFJ77DRAFT_511709 [Powellomyces hirtus]
MDAIPYNPSTSTTTTTTADRPRPSQSQLAASLAKSELFTSLENTLSSLRSNAASATHNAADIGRSAMTVLQLYMEQYPSLQTFVLTASFLSAVPVSVFAIYVALTTLGSIFTAVIGVFLVEGGLIALGLTVLLPIEFGILGLAVAAALARYSGVLGMKAAQDVASRTTNLINEANRTAAELNRVAQQKFSAEILNGAVKRKTPSAPPVTSDDPDD